MFNQTKLKVSLVFRVCSINVCLPSSPTVLCKRYVFIALHAMCYVKGNLILD